MIIRRIVTNLAASDIDEARRFYGDVLGLDVAMDLGWIVTLSSPATASPQLSIATEGGSGTVVPELSIEVDDIAEAERRIRDAGIEIEYGPVTEPWGVRRFYVRDPLGRLVNMVSHQQTK